jgi:hypothetical protein
MAGVTLLDSQLYSKVYKVKQIAKQVEKGGLIVRLHLSLKNYISIYFMNFVRLKYCSSSIR